MGIMQLEPDSPALNNTESLPTVLAAPRASMFTTLFPEDSGASLLKYVEGYPWTVHWYGQLTSQSSSLEHFDPSAPNFTQPVYEIKNLILQVGTALNSSYEMSDGVVRSSGAALVPLGITPNVGDYFVAQVDLGEDAIFCVTSVERMTHRKETLYNITYGLYKYLSHEGGFLDAVAKRVQQTYFFNKDSNYFNRDFLVTPTVKEAQDRLKVFLRESQEHYLSTFADQVSGTIVLPGVHHSLYDPLLLQFIGGFIDHDTKLNHPWYQHRWSDRYLSQKSIYDLLLTRSVGMASSVNQTFSFVPAQQLMNSPRFGTIVYASVDYILYPTSPERDNDVARYHDSRKPASTFTEFHKASDGYFLPALFGHSGNESQCSQKPLLHHLFEQDSYVVSPYFYAYLKDRNAHADKVSFMEVLMARFIYREAIALEDLVRISQTFYEWSSLHQLYMLPVLWLLVRASL